MRLGIWAYTTAVGFACLAVAVIAEIFGGIFPEYFGGKRLPYLTEYVLDFSRWVLILPLLWLIVAIFLSRREAATPGRCFAFAGLSTLAIVFLFTLTAWSLALPFVPLHCLHR